MDNYCKAMLTIIAVALCAITLKLFMPGSSFLNTPTYGDLITLRGVKDQAQRKEAHRNLIKNIPLVRVHGGRVDMD